MSSKPGITAAANKVPTDSCKISESKIKIRLGGIICPSVPDAMMVPQAIPLSYPLLRRVGKVSKPNVMIVAPTIPVVAPISAPNKIMPTAIPPLTPPAMCPITSSRSSARPDFSSMIPIKINSGMASH